ACPDVAIAGICGISSVDGTGLCLGVETLHCLKRYRVAKETSDEITKTWELKNKTWGNHGDERRGSGKKQRKRGNCQAPGRGMVIRESHWLQSMAFPLSLWTAGVPSFRREFIGSNFMIWWG